MNKLQFILTAVIILLSVLVLAQWFLYAERPAMQNSASSAVGTNMYAPDIWKVWRESDYSKATGLYAHYELRYPRDFDVYQGDYVSGGLIGRVRAKIAFPQDAFQVPKTNFGESYVAVSVGKDAGSVKNCYANPTPNNPAGGLVNAAVINGIAFREGTSTDTGAGNIYNSEVYRTLFNNYCYEAVLTVHTGNIYNYIPGAVREFDKEKAFSILREIFQTFQLSTSTQPD